MSLESANRPSVVMNPANEIVKMTIDPSTELRSVVSKSL